MDADSDTPRLRPERRRDIIVHKEQGTHMKKNIALAAAFFIIFLAAPTLLFANWGWGGCFGPYGYGGSPWFGGNFFGGGFFMMIIPLIVLGAIVFFGFQYLKKRDGGVSFFDKESPLDILKARYAKGEISKDTFEAMKREI
jgi:putative membrane protein